MSLIRIRELKKIYGYADRHLRDWFTLLPSYTAYVQRLNKVADFFAPLLEIIQQEHVFGAQAAMGGHRVRTRCLQRAKVKIFSL